ncbi:MAG: ABC transporter ATP-binding protein [Desulfarculaceae bacterium]|nr:ABC transporter ATP-binding protein [Desulfarculaceae bacterium]MCF8064909.1 ABC transporter ATP-binding protein [Desulfarculaceae bacterium]MCF8123722.1 ABC transporter ATP-binding protein [Desulfarculaceae bacterium]
MSMIIARDLVKTYGKGSSLVRALDSVSLEIDAGQFTAVMGPSGSGKSTLLAVLGALNTPEGGTYLVDGIEVFALGSDRRADFRREYLGFVFQSFNLVPYLSLAENVMLPLAIKRLPKKQKLEMAHVALDRVGLAGKEKRLPSEVSGGEQERAAVARALVNQPPILLADEPTGNLDQANTGRMMELLKQLGSEGMTIVMVTHSATCAGYADRVLNMADGKLMGEEIGRVLAAACAV